MPKLIFETPIKRDGTPVDPPHRLTRYAGSVVITNSHDDEHAFLVVRNGSNNHEIGRLYEIATEWQVNNRFYSQLRIED